MRLLVLIPDRLSVLVQKGEITPRYYNPGNLFDEVHILMCNDDKVDSRDVQRTVGEARLSVHNLPEDMRHFIRYTPFFRSQIVQPWARPLLALVKRYQLRLLEAWASPAVELAQQIRPALIRCHGNDYNAYVARCIKRATGIPYAVSLHINPDVNPRRRSLNPQAPWDQRLFDEVFDAIEQAGLREADRVLPVYQPIVPYLQRIGCKNYEVAYNVLSDGLSRKTSYTLHSPVRVISVGRHFSLKNPDNIIRAVADLPQVHFTLVGDGAYQAQLEALAREYQVTDRVTFRPAVPNDELCRLLPEFDIFCVHTEHFELSKSVLEALLTGLPTIINRRQGEPVPELQGDFVQLVENTRDGYYQAIKRLIGDDAFREQLGQKAYAHAQAHWAPAKTEARYVEIYREVMAQAGTCDRP